jgi:hypothetical protein
METTETAIAVTRRRSIPWTHRFWNSVLADAAEDAVKEAHLLPRLIIYIIKTKITIIFYVLINQ